MTRVLPGVYITLNDKSQLPEGATALTVGYVLKANRGPVNEATLVTSAADFLSKYTFSGKPAINEDPTFWDVLKVLPQTNSMYIVRAASMATGKAPMYGGIVFKKAVELGNLVSATKNTKTVVIEGTPTIVAGDRIMISDTGKVDNYYTVGSAEVGDTTTTSFTSTTMEAVNVATASFKAKVSTAGTYDFSYADVISAVSTGSTITGVTVDAAVFRTKVTQSGDTVFTYTNSVWKLNGEEVDLQTYGITIEGTASAGNTITVSYTAPAWKLSGATVDIAEYGITITGTASIGDTIKVILAVGTITNVVVLEEIAEDYIATGSIKVKTAPAKALTSSLASPEAYSFTTGDDLFLIAGIDPGAYNGQFAFEVTSAKDNAAALVYHKGANLGTDIDCTFDTMQLVVKNANTNEVLETFVFSRDESARAIDGTSMYIEDVINGASSYIQVVNNTKFAATATELPFSTPAALGDVFSGAGSDGDGFSDVQTGATTLVAGLNAFADKTVPVSILGNGCSVYAEHQLFQQALLSTAVTRKDCMAFLNSRYQEDERATSSSARAQNIVNYKKNTLANTSFYGTMYTPHVKTPDIYNSRQVRIGCDGVAIAGWLGVINNLSYPYAYAGPQNGIITGSTCDWKIGDESGEAQLLNDASINYIAFDGKVGRYYMQAQNTLQVANSSMRNVGTVLNVLDIKEHFATFLKEYLQLPITTSLRRDIINTVTDYMDPMVDVRLSAYAFQDITTDFDLADNTLRYLLTIAPTPYAQKIYLVMNIVNATFDFSILQSM